MCVCITARPTGVMQQLLLATALHLLTDLLDIIISVLYHPALLSAPVAPTLALHLESTIHITQLCT